MDTFLDEYRQIKFKKTIFQRKTTRKKSLTSKTEVSMTMFHRLKVPMKRKLSLSYLKELIEYQFTAFPYLEIFTLM